MPDSFNHHDTLRSPQISELNDLHIQMLKDLQVAKRGRQTNQILRELGEMGLARRRVVSHPAGNKSVWELTPGGLHTLEML